MSKISINIGVIGGSGFYELLGLEDEQEINVKTPFGPVHVNIGEISGRKIAFLARHGKGHKIPPHRINYRANAFAMFELGVKYTIATNAVGSLKEEIPPKSLVIPDQIIDFTKTRVYTFFDKDFEVTMPDGRKKGGVVHTDVTEPYCEYLRHKIIEAAKVLGIEVIPKGTYICTEGPRFETPAEIRFFRLIGGDIVGMTSSPEVFLFKELEICYASICVVTNYAAGMQDRVSHEEVLALFEEIKPVVANLIREVIKSL